MASRKEVPLFVEKLRALVDLLEDLDGMQEYEKQKRELENYGLPADEGIIPSPPPLINFISARSINSKISKLKIIKDYLYDLERCHRTYQWQLQHVLNLNPNPIHEYFQELANTCILRYDNDFYFEIGKVATLSNKLLEFLDDFLFS